LPTLITAVPDVINAVGHLLPRKKDVALATNNGEIDKASFSRFLVSCMQAAASQGLAAMPAAA
jgi:hypothetical protein